MAKDLRHVMLFFISQYKGNDIQFCVSIKKLLGIMKASHVNFIEAITLK